MKKKTVAVMCMMTLLLTGCGGDFPNLSDEEVETIGEYAAVTLLKYDANSRSRLVDLAQVEESESVSEPELIPEEPVIKPEQSQPESESQPEAQEPTVDISESENTCNSMEEFLDLPESVSISYIGYDLCSSYQEEDNSYFVLEASEGKRLLVLQFTVSNDSSEAQEINLLAREDNYRVTVNENYTRTALTTMLSNDMSTYLDTVEAGSIAEMVLLIEVDATEAENMQGITLNLKNESKTYTIQLL